jgi:ATP-dependent Clp protease ATP-binding subunit ClpA
VVSGQFDASAEVVIEAASAEAKRFGHEQLGTEHLLLGLLAAPQDPAAQALEERGLNAPAVRRRILDLVGPGPNPPRDPAASADEPAVDVAEIRRALEAPLANPKVEPESVRRWWKRRQGHTEALTLANGETVELRPVAQDALSRAGDLSRRRGHGAVDSTDVLLGLLDLQRALVNEILDSHGVDRDRLRRSILGDRAL